MRGREVWLHAIDLGNGASVGDLPSEFVDRLLPEVLGLWKSRGDAVPDVVLRASDRNDLVLSFSDALRSAVSPRRPARSAPAGSPGARRAARRPTQ